MGGYGSGRQSRLNVTDDYLAIDARQWQHEGLLVAGNSFDSSWSRGGRTIGNIGVTIEVGQVRLKYNCQRYGGDWERLDYPVRLQTTLCHYGGVRYWFTCPIVGCGKRVAKLYLGRQYFACRHCYRLAYSCQRETKNDRLIRKADKVRKKLAWEPGILNGGGWKPKGMHWKTFWRLKAEHDRCAQMAMNGVMESFERRFRKNR